VVLTPSPGSPLPLLQPGISATSDVGAVFPSRRSDRRDVNWLKPYQNGARLHLPISAGGEAISFPTRRSSRWGHWQKLVLLPQVFSPPRALHGSSCGHGDELATWSIKPVLVRIVSLPGFVPGHQGLWLAVAEGSDTATLPYFDLVAGDVQRSEGNR